MVNQILKNLFRRKARTGLTVLGIAVGVAMIVALGAMGEGLRAGYASMFSGSSADLVLMQKGAYDITYSTIEEDIVTQVAAMPGVQATNGLIVGNVTAPGTPYFFVFGYDPQGFAIQRFKLVEGQALGASRHITAGSREILIGKQAAEALKFKVGDMIRLAGGSFRVVGIYSTGSGFEDAASVVSLLDAQYLVQKYRHVCAVQVKLKQPQQMERVRARLEKLYPGLTVSQSSQAASQQDMVALIQAMASAIALLAIVIGGIGMMNTVMMSVFERTREIGTLRALGWSRRRVLVMVMAESLAMGMIGGGAGCIAGAALIGPMSQIPALSFLRGTLTLPLLVQGMLTAILLGGIGGIYPAWRASRLLPIEAMHYEGSSGANVRLFSNPQSQRGGPGSGTLRSLWRRRTRTILAIIGISIGLADIVAFSAITDGFTATLGQFIGSNEADLIVRQEGASDVTWSAINERAGKQIAALPGVQNVSGLIFSAVSMEEIPFFVVLGYSPEEPAIRHFRIVEGRGLVGSRELILGRPAADLLKVRTGDMVRLGEMNFRVVGLFETGISWEESGGVVPLRDAQTLLGKPRQVSLYAIKLKDPRQAELVRRQIKAMVSGVTISLSSEMAEIMPEMQNLRVLVWAVSALVIVVGGIGMMNTMIMSVFERTREIGTLRALGWRRRQVLTMLLKESLLLVLIGVVMSVVLAAGLNVVIQQIPAWAGWLSMVFSPRLMLQVLLVGLMLGTVGGLYPAWRAANLSPVEALRYE